MSTHLDLAKRLQVGGAVAVMAFTATVTVPSLAAAQNYGAPPPPPGQYAQPCHKDRTAGTLFGALIGAGIGAVLGVALAANGHGGDGLALGAGLGAVGGGVVGDTASRCPDAPPPPPARGYNGAGGPPPAQQTYSRDPNEGYRDAPPAPANGGPGDPAANSPSPGR